MIINRPQNDLQSPRRKLAHQALSLTRVSIIAMATVLMPIATSTAFARGAGGGHSSSQNFGNIPTLPGLPGSSGTFGAPSTLGSGSQGRLMRSPGSSIMSSPSSGGITNPGGIGAPDSQGTPGGVGGVGGNLMGGSSIGGSSMGGSSVGGSSMGR